MTFLHGQQEHHAEILNRKYMRFTLPKFHIIRGTFICICGIVMNTHSRDVPYLTVANKT
jgi:hypothetical protein